MIKKTTPPPRQLPTEVYSGNFSKKEGALTALSNQTPYAGLWGDFSIHGYHPTCRLQETPSRLLYEGPMGTFNVGIAPVWACLGKKGMVVLPVDAFKPASLVIWPDNAISLDVLPFPGQGIEAVWFPTLCPVTFISASCPVGPTFFIDGYGTRAPSTCFRQRFHPGCCYVVEDNNHTPFAGVSVFRSPLRCYVDFDVHSSFGLRNASAVRQGLLWKSGVCLVKSKYHPGWVIHSASVSDAD